MKIVDIHPTFNNTRYLQELQEIRVFKVNKKGQLISIEVDGACELKLLNKQGITSLVVDSVYKDGTCRRWTGDVKVVTDNKKVFVKDIETDYKISNTTFRYFGFFKLMTGYNQYTLKSEQKLQEVTLLLDCTTTDANEDEFIQGITQAAKALWKHMNKN